MSAKAGTKFGVKEFRKDMCKQPLTEKMCCLLECIEEYGYSVKSLAEKNDNGYEIYKTATEKLYQFGYLKRYIVDGMGEVFYLISTWRTYFIYERSSWFYQSDAKRENFKPG
ncbi:MAG: hypothetical protein V8R97_12595 [Fusicatenibacter saccharivorans]